MPNKTPTQCISLKKAIFFCVKAKHKDKGPEKCEDFYTGYTKCLMNYYSNSFSYHNAK
jgi:hypothetical protein